MAITATLLSIAKRQNDEGAQVVTVLYTDNLTFKVAKDYALTACSLAILTALVRSEATHIQTTPPVVDLAGVTEGMAFDLTPIVIEPVEPTPEEKARAAFFALWRLAQAQTRAIAYGLLDQNESGVLETTAAVKKGFLPAYLEFM